ncbi:MAG TPA: serine/threonine-protein kinase, partial [Polyangiaceae bacterium]|nr:serine/threonine-protein kinase [Polyangiaceae bacterium]
MSILGRRQRIAGRYLLESEIGAGGMGIVWRARDERLGRDVAVKLLAANAIGNDVARARLLREARAAGRLQHEGIVHVYDVGETGDGGAFLVMELVSGYPLRDWMEDGKLSIDDRVEIVVGIASALQCAHELGIVHRDVKPENVLVRSSGRPVLLDFGLAKPIASPLVETLGESHDIRLTGTGAVVGTPAYLAPEQVKGEPVVAPADQFSLAVLTFELLTGRLPWKGTAMLEVIASMLHDTPLSVQDLAPELPVGVGPVLERAMQKDPAQRYPSVAAFAEALRAFFPNVSTSRVSSLPPPAPRVRPTSTPGALRSASPETGMARRAFTPASRTPSRRWLRVLAAFGAVAAALLVAGIVIYRANRAASAPAARSVEAPVALTKESVVACPLFKLEGDLPDPSNGWLAAAAAALACDRVQVLLGGSPTSTLAPAELVPGLPREPTEDAPADPFNKPELYESTLAAAKKLAPIYVEGRATKLAWDFSAEVTLRARDGRQLAHGEGKGEELFEAISAAVRQAKPSFGDGAASEF